MPIRWGDMDAQRHVNNTVYFRFMEQARISFFDRYEVGGGGGNLPPECSPVVITASCTYLRALAYPGSVEIRMFLSDPGRTSVMTFYEMRPSYDPEVVYAEGEVRMVWIGKELNKSIPLPSLIRTLAEKGAPL
ncbi:MAG: acyl-CoA thioesterase [Burkholderiales bacterium]